MNYKSSHHANSTFDKLCAQTVESPVAIKFSCAATRESELFKEFPLFVSVRCSVLRLKGLLFRHLPVLSWLPKYKVKDNLLCDVISGVSASTIQVPQGQSILSLMPLSNTH